MGGFSLSIESLSLDLVIVPSLFVFLTMLVPLPLLSKLVSKFVLKVESVQAFKGISILVVSTALSFLFFAFSVNKHWTQYSSANRPQNNYKEWDVERLKHERNMYLHCLSFVLVAALLKISRMTLKIEKANKSALGEKKDQ